MPSGYRHFILPRWLNLVTTCQIISDVDAMFRELRHILDEYSRERTRFSVGEINVFD
jgi:hypothetical protein